MRLNLRCVVVGVILVGMFISACSGEGDKSNSIEGATVKATPVDGSNMNTDKGTAVTVASLSLLQNVPSVVDHATHLPVIEGMPGRLLIVQGNTDNQSQRLGAGGRLYLATFDGKPMTKLAERVSEHSIQPSASGQRIAYVAVDGRSWYVFSIEIETKTIHKLYKLPNRFGFILGWSPDENWILFRDNETTYVANISGEKVIKLGESYSFWTDDNRVMGLSVGHYFDDKTDQPIESSFLLDPATDIRKPIDLGLETLSADALPYETIMQALEAEGTALIETSSGLAGVFGYPSVVMPGLQEILVVDSEGQPNRVNNCLKWWLDTLEFGGDGTHNTIYETENTLSLTDFHQSMNGDIFFQRWYMEDCQPEAENLRAEVIHLASDGEVQVLAEDIYPGISTGFIRASSGEKYALAPDGNYIAWVSGSLTSLNSAVKIADLDTGTTSTLLTWTSDNANNFLVLEAYNAVFWIP